MSTNTTEPPAAAVAKDAHWSAKMARLRARKLPERTLSICDDQDAKTAVTEAALVLAKARAGALAECTEQGIREEQRDAWVASNPQVLAADTGLTRAQDALADATLTLTFRAVPRPVWEQLLRDHAPSEAQADQGMEYNVDTFPAALISACHVERDAGGAEVEGMSAADAQELLDTWADAEAKALFTAALVINQTLRADLGKG
ncbi:MULTISPECIES: hypothetical protein [unclassified Streptomyces]|uniref:hypothetical protein n=1 Tax=unclassified Streptomyces TaxID=2593676 RepID=UPI0029B36D08|nr:MULTISPECIES: hypothetical protein [unclassified Streptomyces]MDX3766409.1 hypothetical protein [Streptomyces sp. AK08-01B]MDX3816334.1 hypothetical protein [Streptomyces sp. AK08-01A]